MSQSVTVVRPLDHTGIRYRRKMAPNRAFDFLYGNQGDADGACFSIAAGEVNFSGTDRLDLERPAEPQTRQPILVPFVK